MKDDVMMKEFCLLIQKDQQDKLRDLDDVALRLMGYEVIQLEDGNVWVQPDELAQLDLVTKYPIAIEVIKHIKNPSERVQMACVEQDFWSIRYIKNPSEQVQMACVTQNSLMIQHIKNPTEQVKLACVRRLVT